MATAATDKTTKEAVLEMIRKMPDDVSLEEIFDAVRLRFEIEKSLRNVIAGKAVNHEEAMKRLAKWHK